MKTKNRKEQPINNRQVSIPIAKNSVEIVRVVVFFHRCKVKKIKWLLFKENVKKYLDSIIFKCFENQFIVGFLIDFDFSDSFKKCKLYFSKFIFFIINQ